MGAATLLKAGQADAAAGRTLDAERRFREALQQEPQFAAVHLELGNLLFALDRFEEAGYWFETALRVRPDHAETVHNLGTVQMRAGRFAEAEDCFLKALRLRPKYAEANNSYGTLLRRSGDIAGAYREYLAAIRADPACVPARLNLAVWLKDQRRFDEACQECAALLRKDPDHVEARYVLGSALFALGKTRDALAELDSAIRLNPNHAEARFSRGVALLALGNYAEGWEGFEWRLRRDGFRQRDFKRPRWDGRMSLQGKRLLVHAEHDEGDTILFVRFIKALKDRGAFVILECQPSLTRLMASAPGVDAVVAAGSAPPSFDLQVPLLSLPLTLGIGRETIPAPSSYLSAEKEQVARWEERLAGNRRLRIGVGWNGDPQLPLANMIPLAERPEDYAATAAMIANLDLVISSDSALAHLTAALGCPVWVMLGRGCGFHWLLDRDASPWYPCARLFRQSNFGGWSGVIDRITDLIGADLQLPGVESVLTRS